MKRIALLASFLTALAAAPHRAHAVYTITFTQVGNNVVATGTGSLITAGLEQRGGTFNALTGVRANSGFALIGPAAASAPQGASYSAYFTGPSSYGIGATIFRPDSGAGPLGGLEATTGALYVSAGYVSGTAISGSTSTYLNRTIAGLGLVAGTYFEDYAAIPGGDTIDTIIIQVGPLASVPEPASVAMLGLGLAGVGAFARMRRRS